MQLSSEIYGEIHKQNDRGGVVWVVHYTAAPQPMNLMIKSIYPALKSPETRSTDHTLLQASQLYDPTPTAYQLFVGLEEGNDTLIPESSLAWYKSRGSLCQPHRGG